MLVVAPSSLLSVRPESGQTPFPPDDPYIRSSFGLPAAISPRLFLRSSPSDTPLGGATIAFDSNRTFGVKTSLSLLGATAHGARQPDQSSKVPTRTENVFGIDPSANAAEAAQT